MKRCCFFLIGIINLIFSIHPSCGQNLVPNSGFENHYDCTNSVYYIDNTVGWHSVQSPDYFNACVNPDTSDVVIYDVPNNYFGYQFPKEGQAYAGLIPFVYYNYREYVFVELSQALVSNKKYCVRFYVSLSDSSTWAVNKLGAYLSVDSLSVPPYQPLPSPPWSIFTYYLPQIESATMLSDTTGWVEVSGTFTAAGGERYITIGNFRDDAQTDTMRIQNRSVHDYYSYYYIDEVSVYPLPEVYAGNDTAILVGDSVQLGTISEPGISYSWSPVVGLNNPFIANPKASPLTTTTYTLAVTDTNSLACTHVLYDTVTVYLSGVGITESGRAVNTVEVYPNPARDELLLHFSEKIKAQTIINLYDLTGKLVRSYELKPGSDEQELDARNVQTGLYLYEVVIDGKLIKKDKVAIVK